MIAICLRPHKQNNSQKIILESIARTIECEISVYIHVNAHVPRIYISQENMQGQSSVRVYSLLRKCTHFNLFDHQWAYIFHLRQIKLFSCRFYRVICHQLLLRYIKNLFLPLCKENILPYILPIKKCLQYIENIHNDILC